MVTELGNFSFMINIRTLFTAVFYHSIRVGHVFFLKIMSTTLEYDSESMDLKRNFVDKLMRCLPL